MPLYRYVKAKPKQTRKYPVFLSFVFLSLGSSILLWVLWPIASFMLFTAPFFSATVSPLAQGTTLRSPIIDTVQAANLDYTNANVWFPSQPQKRIVTPVNSYKLSVPKLGIREALVTIAGDDLNHSLIHYGGTGLPGEYGNAVIFGHSVLPQFYDPKNYTTIFSTLPTLKLGDDIIITYDAVTYRYRVFDIVIREPNDLSVLEQTFDDSYMTLVTCVPPGTYAKRLNVRTKLLSL